MSVPKGPQRALALLGGISAAYSVQPNAGLSSIDNNNWLRCTSVVSAGLPAIIATGCGLAPSGTRAPTQEWDHRGALNVAQNTTQMAKYRETVTMNPKNIIHIFVCIYKCV